MARILHTADWQLGLKLRRVGGDKGARARDERFRTVERIAAAAHQHAVDAVVVAGDVFDDNQVSPYVLQLARDALRRFAPVPVLLLPGNHDAAEPGGVLSRVLAGGAAGLDHVRVLLDDRPVELAGAVFHPCPLRQRHSPDDPTRALPPRPPGDGALRIAVAHGGVLDFGALDAVNRIDVASVVAKGYDYVALGDWHGTKQVHPRAWYAGAPEPTRFKELEPGQVLLVDVPSAGAVPQVTAVPVAGTRWHEEHVELRGPDDVSRLEGWLGSLAPRGSTLVRLHLSGALHVADRARLDALLQAADEELLFLQVEDDDLRTVIDAGDRDRIDAPGFLGDALDDLLAHDDEAHREAARLLYAMLAEVQP